MVRTFRVGTFILTLLLIGIYPEQLIPLVVAMAAGLMVVEIERLTR